MSPIERQVNPPLVRPWVLTAGWAIVLVAGLAVWVTRLGSADPSRAWIGLLAAFCFFTSLGAGLVVWSAIVLASRGRWMGELEKLTTAGLTMCPISLLALGGLWMGRRHWAPWAGMHDLPQGLWLNETFLFSRDAAALALFWAVAIFYVALRARGRGKILGGVLIVVYAIVFSLLGFDLVMALDPRWYSSLFGGYFFISGLYIAAAAWAFMAVWRREATADRLHDIGKLIVAFSLLTTYMMFSQLLPIWYENLPAEVRFPTRRLNILEWRWVSAALLAAVYLGPLVLLLTIRAKRTRWMLGAISLLTMAGMWVERWWLVAPTLDGGVRLGGDELSITAAFAALLAIGAGWINRRRAGVIEREAIP